VPGADYFPLDEKFPLEIRETSHIGLNKLFMGLEEWKKMPTL